MATKDTSIVRALDSFVGGIGKDEYHVTEGDLYSADDPFVKKHPTKFGPVALHASTPQRVEQATAAPGEKRGA